MTTDGATESDTIAAVDQRIRVKWTNAINEFVALTYFAEVDTPWGIDGTKSPGNDGALGADGINIETKNAYLDLKLPNTPVAARLGIQGVADLGLQNAYVNDDMAAAAFMLQISPVSLNLILAKLQEGDVGNTDDNNLYGVQAAFAAAETLKFAAELYWNNVQAHGGVADDNADIYTLGVSGDMKFGPVGVDAFVAYQMGTAAGDVDVAALAATANASMKAGPADLALRVIYYGNDDDAQDDNSFNALSGALEFAKEGQEIFLTNVNKCNISADRYALTESAYAGYGLLAGILKAGMTVDKFALKGSVGYYMALNDQINDTGVDSVEGTDLGFELDASAGYKVVDNAVVSVRGAYALLGSFFDDPAGDDPDNLWRAVLALDVTF
jgi:hypothetical protein